MQTCMAFARSPSAQSQAGPATEPTPMIELECATAYCNAIAPPDDKPEMLTWLGSPPRLSPSLSSAQASEPNARLPRTSRAQWCPPDRRIWKIGLTFSIQVMSTQAANVAQLR